MRRVAVATCLIGTMFAFAPQGAHAELPSWLRIENGKIRDGNEKLTKGDAKSALADYDQAARELPDAPGVQLDRGLALMKSGDLAKARESLLSATQPTAPPALRADAYQNLALAFYREGDQLAGQQKHKEAQQMFRESLDAGKRSLRLRPGDPNVAWNLELAARRIREEEEKQKEEEQKQKDEQKDKDQKQDGSQGDKNQDQKNDQDQQKQDEQKQDEQKEDQQKQDEQKQDQGKGDDQKKPPEQKPDQAKPESKGQPDKQDPQEQPGDQTQPQLPQEAEQALDALSDSEENFERYRARQRASRERRAPEKDW